MDTALAETLGGIREQHATEKIALMQGVFDTIQPRDMRRLELAKRLATVTVVGLCSDENSRYWKRITERTSDYASREKALRAVLRDDDYLFELNGPDYPSSLMEQYIPVLQPDYYLLSSLKYLRHDRTLATRHTSGRVTYTIIDKNDANERQLTTKFLK